MAARTHAGRGRLRLIEASPAQSLLVLSLLGFVLVRAFLDLLPVFILRERIPTHPGEAHVVDRSLPERDQVVWIGIEPVRRGVVVIANPTRRRTRGDADPLRRT